MSRVVFVTGCSSGFGRDLSERLARQGDRVYATMRATEGKNAGAARALRDRAADEHLDLHVLDVDVTIALMELDPGTRPFRSVVGVDFGVQARNSAVELFDAEVLEAFGLTSFATLVPEGEDPASLRPGLVAASQATTPTGQEA